MYNPIDSWGLRMTRKFHIILLLFWALFWAGCGDDEKPTNDKKSVIMPLEIGNEWSGTQRLFALDGTETDEYAWTFHLFEDVLAGDERWFNMEYIIDGDTIDPGLIFINRDNGLWAQIPCGLGVCQTEIWALYPAMVNDSFLTADSAMPTATVIAVDTVITVPAGTYDCYAYRWNPAFAFGDFIIYYLSPDFGLVMREVYSLGPADELYRSELWVLENRKLF